MMMSTTNTPVHSMPDRGRRALCEGEVKGKTANIEIQAQLRKQSHQGRSHIAWRLRSVAVDLSGGEWMLEWVLVKQAGKTQKGIHETEII